MELTASKESRDFARIPNMGALRRAYTNRLDLKEKPQGPVGRMLDRIMENLMIEGGKRLSASESEDGG